ncbi:MAG TPA: CDP-alcohol phosphatidyltransferase family protein, partial [Vicinamibacteria bacterium]
ASMGVYALLGARRDADLDGKGAQFLGGAGAFFPHWFLWAIRPATAASLRLGLSPDFYNFAGLALGLAAGVLLAQGRVELGGWAIALSGVCDILDGRIARLTAVASRYGDFIDSVLDRFVEAFAFLGLTVYLRPHPAGPFLAAAALSGSMLVSYARARGDSLGVDCPGGLMQRAERLVLTILACLLDGTVCAWLRLPAGTVLVWALGLMAAGTGLTAVHRTVWIARRLPRA